MVTHGICNKWSRSSIILKHRGKTDFITILILLRADIKFSIKMSHIPYTLADRACDVRTAIFDSWYHTVETAVVLQVDP